MSVRNYQIYLILILIISFYLQLINITDILLDTHSFRQTQTAISSYWLLKEKFTFQYLTPLFGFPWSIPFEFPIFQMFVAFTGYLFDIQNLDFLGRTVSLFFYYFSFIPLYLILKELKLNKKLIYTIFIITLSTPIFIFWSRTFMIESTALFFSLFFILSSLIYDRKPSYKILFLIFTLGIISALTKITTFLIALLFLFYYFLFFKNLKDLITKKIILIATVIIVSILIAMVWTNYTDTIKELNILASSITSSKLNSWNFGTIFQRLDINNYKQILHHILNNSFYFLFLPFIIYFKENRNLTLVCIFTYISSFLILFNLYLIHNYYWYANSIFLVIAFSIFFYNLSNYLKNTFIINSLLIFFISINYFTYYNYYFKLQNKDMSKNKIILISNYIKENTDTNDLIFIDGLDWNASLSYYAKRKSIMMPNWENSSITNKKFDKLVKDSLKTNQLTSIILCNGTKEKRELINFFKFKNYKEKIINNCTIIVKEKSFYETK